MGVNTVENEEEGGRVLPKCLDWEEDSVILFPLLDIYRYENTAIRGR